MILIGSRIKTARFSAIKTIYKKYKIVTPRFPFAIMKKIHNDYYFGSSVNKIWVKWIEQYRITSIQFRFIGNRSYQYQNHSLF